MAALSALPAHESGLLVWQKVKQALSNANPGAQAAFKALREYVVQQKGNPNLTFKAFSKADLITANDGLGLGAGTAKVYGIYIKKGDDATDATFVLVDNGTDDNIYSGSLTASYAISIFSRIAEQEDVYMNPGGYDILLGIRLASVTAPSGTTVSAAEADSVDGFIVYGAA